jgi:hypothetical protein
MVCLRYVIVNTLHKGGGGVDDDDKSRLDQKFQLLPGHLSATEWQTAMLMSTAYIICKVLG